MVGLPTPAEHARSIAALADEGFTQTVKKFTRLARATFLNRPAPEIDRLTGLLLSYKSVYHPAEFIEKEEEFFAALRTAWYGNPPPTLDRLAEISGSFRYIGMMASQFTKEAIPPDTIGQALSILEHAHHELPPDMRQTQLLSKINLHYSFICPPTPGILLYGILFPR